MGTGVKIRCKHCGAEFIDLVGVGLMGFDSGAGTSHIETEKAIRCPQCMKRLNNTAEEFEEQVMWKLLWD